MRRGRCVGAHRANPFLSAVGVLKEEPRRVELDGEPPGLERRLHRAPGARSLCGPPIECVDSLEKSRLIFLARETRAFSGLASVRASHSRTRVWRHTRTRTGESRLLSIARRPLTEDTEDTMPEDGVTLTPTVLWAQRKDRLLITIDLPNPEHPRIDLEDDGNMTFSATAGKDGEERRRYEVSLEFMHPVIAKDSKISVGNRQVFVMVMKTKEVSGRDPDSHEPALQPRYHGSVPPVRDPNDGPRHHEGAYRSRYTTQLMAMTRYTRGSAHPRTRTFAVASLFPHPRRSPRSPIASIPDPSPNHRRSSPASTGRGCSRRKVRSRTSRPTSTSGSTRTRKKKTTETPRSTSLNCKSSARTNTAPTMTSSTTTRMT